MISYLGLITILGLYPFGTIDVHNSNFNIHELASEYQPDKPIIRVLLPDQYDRTDESSGQ